MSEKVVPVDLGVVWDPNDPDAVLVADDRGAALALRPRADDTDQRTVVLVWTGTHYSSMGGPNGEAIAGHRLYGKGLEDVLWIGEVSNSELVAMLEKQNNVHPQHDSPRFADLAHHVVLTKEQVIEVVARGLEVRRIEGSRQEAAVKALF